MEKDAKWNPEDDDRMIDAAYSDLLDGYLASNHRKKVEIIERAYRFARQAHQGVRRRSGEPYIMHPLAVAKIVSREIGLGSTSICAALLHDVVEDTDYTVEDIEQNFGPKIAQLVEGLTKISGGIFGDKASAQAENFRKLLLTMSEDIRVVLIKMADRLHNMRTLGSMAPNKRYKIAGETLYIYAPLAHRLGLFAIKTELEDLSFKHEHPEIYHDIEEKIRQTQARRSAVYSDFSAPIKEKLDGLGIQYEATARVKSIYSIYRKMENKHVPFEEVYDLYAMRIIFECDDQSKEKAICWSIYSAITDLYQLHPARTRDWIVTPKANGYQALHLTVMGPDGNWIEVQIRSRRMDEIAEKGFAAHWRYKIGEGDEESELNAWLKTIKDILDNPEPSAIDFLSTLKLNLFSSEIVVFTPKGEVMTLPAGATVLDLAFQLHSDIGLHTIAGKVNHKLVPLQHELKSGDQVEVLTSKTQMPRAEWEKFLVTAKGRTRLRKGIRALRQPMIVRGNEILVKWLADNELPESNLVMTKLQGIFHVDNRDELCYQLGADEIVLGDYLVKTLRHAAQGGAAKKRGMLSKIFTAARKATFGGGKTDDPGAAPNTTTPPEAVNPKQIYVLSSTEGEANFVLAPCCNPIPGDEVLGFITDDGRVEIHAVDCPQAQVLKAGFGTRIVATRWADVAQEFTAHVHIEGIDRRGILQELTQLISSHMGIDMRKLEIEASGEVFHCDLWVRVGDADVVEALCRHTTEINGVTSAARIH
ncbi:MAG: bifunctional (p)ppGpp synthetase/guanosine-3',5'-bis(diphosphate) 3'-pyrophosphohydrolase [Bacteroidales bacterium]|nr:bifunctional (p)ppGpp synthetase/guanosine-3',5'-bis(diphosphate) 3'-pyrophosphohydrolase [Bacteroidales bacterium]